MLTGLSTGGITLTRKKTCWFQAVLYRSVITPVSPYEAAVSCRKPDTSSLSSDKLAFGSVMLELLDSSSAGIRLPTHPRPVSSHTAAVMPDEASHPAEHHGSPVPLSPWQLVTCSPPPSLCSPFPECVFKAGQKCNHVTCTTSHTSPLLSPLIHYPGVLFPFIPFHFQRHPHFEVTERDATNPAGKLRLIALPLLNLL